MEIFTLNVGQGNLTVVKHGEESIVIDTRIPPTGSDCEFVKGALRSILANTNLVGLVLTGFDSDHADSEGVKIVIHKYQPNWLMYPAYRHETAETGRVFRAINNAESLRPPHRPLTRRSMRLDKGVQTKFGFGELAANFKIEVFSPHIDDLTNSNSGSLVVKLTSPMFSYLVTGDTETRRWDKINRIFGSRLRSDVMAAPHHGSRNGANEDTMALVGPHTVLISAGQNNQFGHPHQEALSIFRNHAQEVHSTSSGCTLWTRLERAGNSFTLVTSACRFT